MENKANQRIFAIDLIRGYFLFVILIDHLGRYFGIYDLFTGGGTQWVSAAEGFFFVSGLMIGLVRGRKLLAEPLKTAAKKVWGRAFQLYLWSVGLTTLFTITAQFFINNPGLKEGAFHNQSLLHFAISTLTLRYNYGWADFLVYYVIYLTLTPIALWLLRKGQWRILLGISLCIWILADNVQLAWQVLFFSGSIIGFYLFEIESWFKKLKPSIRRLISFPTVIFGVITIAASLFMNTIVDIMNRPTNSFNPLGRHTISLYNFNKYHLAGYFDKYSLGIGRLLFFYIWFAMLYLLVRRYEAKLVKLVGWFFTPLGQNSLYVYIVHAVIVFFLDLFVARSLPIWLNVVINTAFLSLIWGMVKFKFLFKIIPR